MTREMAIFWGLHTLPRAALHGHLLPDLKEQLGSGEPQTEPGLGCGWDGMVGGGPREQQPLGFCFGWGRRGLSSRKGLWHQLGPGAGWS